MLPITILLILQLLDISSTYYVLSRGGREWNRLLAWLFARYGTVVPLVAIKLLFMVLIYALFANGYISAWLLWCMVVLYIGVIGWNVSQVIKARA